MLYNKKFLAIIPARGGSKRLPRKNVLDLAGKPLIAWTIKAAINSKYIDTVVVSSDDQEILDISATYGAKILKRPESLASDAATTFDTLIHALDYYSEYEYIILLQPTSPLRSVKDIDEAIELLFLKNADAIISVCEMDHNPLWSNVLPENGDMSNFLPNDLMNKRSQDLPSYYRLNGAIYICKIEKFLREKTLFLNKNIFAYQMNQRSSVDIDEEIDFDLAEFYIMKRDKGSL